MPTAFTTEERAHIMNALRLAGRSLFTSQGLRKTSLDELVGPAGIVKSTFYAFFDSKEALYLDLILEGAEQIRRRTIEEGLQRGSGTRDALRRYLYGAVDVVTNDPLYQRLTTHPQELAAVMAKLDAKAVARAADSGLGELTEFVAAAQRSGELPDTRPETVVGVLRAVLLITRHTSEFGAGYSDVRDLLIDSITTGLTRKDH